MFLAMGVLARFWFFFFPSGGSMIFMFFMFMLFFGLLRAGRGGSYPRGPRQSRGYRRGWRGGWPGGYDNQANRPYGPPYQGEPGRQAQRPGEARPYTAYGEGQSYGNVPVQGEVPPADNTTRRTNNPGQQTVRVDPPVGETASGNGEPTRPL